ncbi:hypothetical protein Pcinc_039132 [Petrolisthes cinctipes]|uniref:Uncharacterized protein n=1 Tax=Petrolisthes cinctipes TaxID=88211 RepID=A0AAE1BP22_PETCI|nr:hypothetical protein Pcinc_039132 [Petrolisthes cinctipes]
MRGEEERKDQTNNNSSRTSSKERKKISVLSRGGESELRLSQVTKVASGNYTCVPANARPSSVTLHIITGLSTSTLMRLVRLGSEIRE